MSALVCAAPSLWSANAAAQQVESPAGASSAPAGRPADAQPPAASEAPPFEHDVWQVLQDAQAQQNAGRCGDAIPLYTRVLASVPTLVSALHDRAGCYVRTGQREAAVTDYREVIRHWPGDADSLGALGWSLIVLGRFAEAQEVTRKAHQLEPLIDAWALNLGHTYLLQGNPDQAREYYRKALELIAGDERFREGPLADFDLFVNKGWSTALVERERQWMQSEYPRYQRQRNAQDAIARAINLQSQARREEARQAWTAALQVTQSAFGDEHLRVATVINALAALHESMGRYAEALPLYERGLAIFEKALGPEHPAVAASLNSLAHLHQAMGDYGRALPRYQRSLAIYEKVHGAEHPNVAASLNNLAGLYKSMGDYGRALPLYQRSVAMDQRTYGPKHPTLATSLNNLAGLYELMGRYSDALPLYQRSLAIEEEALGAARPEVASALNNLAGLYASMGEYARALPLFQRSLAILEKERGADHPDVATTLNNLADLYRSMNENTRALPLYQRGLAIREKTLGAEHPDVASSLNSLALLHHAMGDYAAALPLFQRALAIREKALGAEHPGVATSLNNLALLYGSMGRYSEALPLYQRSLRMYEKILGPEHPLVALNFYNASLDYWHLGQRGEAEALLRRALPIASRGDQPELLSRVQSALGVVLSERGEPDSAIYWFKQAVNTIQSLRAGLTDLDRGLQQSFLQNKRAVYTDLADLLITEGRIPEAQRVMAMLKEEEYFDFVRRDASADPRSTDVPLTGVERKAHERFYAVREQLATLAKEREVLERKQKIGEASGADTERLKTIDADLEKARLAFDDFLGSLAQQLAADPVQARRAEAVQSQIESHQNLLVDLGAAGQGVAAVQFIAGEQRLHLILSTASVQLAREVPISRVALNAKITAFREAIQNPKIDPRPLGRELYAMLIGPLEQDLEAQGAHTLILFLDGALRYVPFAALVHDDAYLIERYRLAIYTEAAGARLAQPPQSRWQVAALGVTQPHEGFSALPAVKGELEGIVRPDVLPGEMELDERFTLAQLQSMLDNPVLHIASHFRFVPGSDASFLLLGDGSHLTLRDIRARGLRFNHVELLTLSACETAVGGRRSENGLEVEGLGVLAQKQGARAVLATLWPVADSSTGQLMQQFYRLRQKDNTTKAEALRQAQLGLLRGVPTDRATATGATGIAGERGVTRATASIGAAPTFPTDPARPYAHPYYWAPFILMGNWL